MNKITTLVVGIVAVLAAIFGVIAFTASSDEDASLEGGAPLLHAHRHVHLHLNGPTLACMIVVWQVSTPWGQGWSSPRDSWALAGARIGAPAGLPQARPNQGTGSTSTFSCGALSSSSVSQSSRF